MSARTPDLQEKLWTARTWPFIASVLALMTFIAFESFAVTTVLPVAMADLGDIGWYSFAYAATITTALIGMVVGGNWADRSGPRVPLIVGGSIFLFGLALSVVAPESMTFVLGRLLQGIGGGIDSVILYVLIARHIPEGPRPRMFGLLTAAWLVPSLAGPVIAGALTDLMTWRAVFGIVLAGAAVSLLALLHVTRTPVLPRGAGAARPERGVWSGIIGRNGALACLAAALLVALHLSSQLSPPVSVLVVAVASVALLATARTILPAGTLLLRGGPQRLVALRAILGATVATINLYLTLYLQSERGYPPTTAGLVIAMGASGWALGAWVQGRFSATQASHRRLILHAALLVATGAALVLTYTGIGLPLWGLVIGCVSMGAGMGAAYPRLASATLTLAGAQEHGAYSSALQSGESMGIGVTTALIAVVLATGATFTAAFGILLVLAGAGIVIALRGAVT